MPLSPPPLLPLFPSAAPAPQPAASRQAAPVWREIPGYEGLYDASDQGGVRRSFSCKRTGNVVPGKLLGISRNRRYPKIELSRNGIARHHSLHQIIAETFLGPCPDGYEVNHIDGNKQNAAASNLEYTTKLQNMAHAVATGLYPSGDRNGSRTKPESRPRGERHALAKVTVELVRKIREWRDAGETLTAISSKSGVCFQNVHSIVTRKTWRHI